VTGPERAALALRVWCGFCWARPGTACTGDGHHLARYIRAYRRGLISKQAMATVCESLPMASAGQLIADATTPASGSAIVTGNRNQTGRAKLR